MQVTGTYYDGQIKLDRTISSKYPLRVTVVFNDNTTVESKRLEVADFSFLESQELLKNVHTSFAEEVIIERRAAL